MRNESAWTEGKGRDEGTFLDLCHVPSTANIGHYIYTYCLLQEGLTKSSESVPSLPIGIAEIHSFEGPRPRQTGCTVKVHLFLRPSIVRDGRCSLLLIGWLPPTGDLDPDQSRTRSGGPEG